MPKIEPYRQQTSARTTLPGPIDMASGAGAGALGRALESVGDDQARLKVFERGKAEERDAVAANERLMGLRSRWAEELPKRQSTAAEGAEGFTLGVLKDFDTEAEESIKGASTERGRNHLKARLSDLRLGLQQDALGFEARKGVEFKLDGLSRSIDGARTAAEFRPQDFGTLAAEQRAAIEASGLPVDAQRELMQRSVTSLAGAAVEGMIRRNPYAALTYLNAAPIRAQDGSRASANPDGTVSTMLTATVEVQDLNGGRPTNIPTFWDGKEQPIDAAVKRAIQSGRTFPAFESIEDATSAAKNASAEKGKNLGAERLAVHALTFEQRQQLRSSAETEIRRRESEANARKVEARQAMDDRLRDIGAAAQLGIPITDVPDESTLKLLYGEQQGAQRYKAAQIAVDVSGTVAQMHTLSTPELLQQASSARPTQVAGAADQAQLANFLAGRTEAIVQAREKDPAGYLTQYSPAVRESWQAFAAAPAAEQAAARDAYLSAVRADRERLGIPGDDVLPDSYAQAVADNINTAANGEQLATAIEQEGARWGSAWPTVYGQLAPKMSDLALVVGSGIPRPAATALTSLAKLKDSELKALLPPSTKWEDVQTSVDAQLEDFARSFPAEGARTYGAFREAAVRLTVRNMQQGASRGDAAAKAFADLIGSQYQMIEFHSTTIRAPAQLDRQMLRDGAQVALEAFEPNAAAIAMPIGAVLSAEEYAAQYGTYVREHGYWVTSPDGEGVRLYVDGGPVIDAAGPVERSWQALQALHGAANLERTQQSRETARRRQEMR